MINLKQETYVGRHGKLYPKQELEIMTRSLEMAQQVYPAAGPGDVGDLKIHYNPNSRRESKEAEKVFNLAKKEGIRFLLLADNEELDGKLLNSWNDVKAALKEAKKKKVKAKPVGVSRVAGGLQVLERPLCECGHGYEQHHHGEQVGSEPGDPNLDMGPGVVYDASCKRWCPCSAYRAKLSKAERDHFA